VGVILIENEAGSVQAESSYFEQFVIVDAGKGGFGVVAGVGAEAEAVVVEVYTGAIDSEVDKWVDFQAPALKHNLGDSRADAVDSAAVG